MAPFPTTICSLLLQPEGSQDAQRESAQRLGELYREPIRAYLEQALGLGPEDADDLTQDVFLALLSGSVLEGYVRERGPFRAYLKGVLHHFVRKHARSARAKRRGGGARALPLDEALGVAGSSEDPAAAFDRAWVRRLLDDSLEAVRLRLESEGRGREFEVFRAYEFPPPGERPTYDSLAEQHGLTSAKVRHALSRVRERLRTELRSRLTETVTSAAELEAEWTSLFQGA